MDNLELLLLNQIKNKSQISDLDNAYILRKINSYLLKNGDINKKLKLKLMELDNTSKSLLKNKLFKQVIKEIKKEIGIVYGSFLTNKFKKKDKILTSINDLNNEEEVTKLLALHKSTRERTEFYSQIYEKIFLWKKPKKIVDLGCGMNPLSYSIIKNILDVDIKYFASDINPNDMAFLNIFFKKYGISGEAKAYDLTQEDILKEKQLENCDMVFLFKALDSLEYVKRNISKELLINLPIKNIVVSFPTKSLKSGEKFKIEKRNWFINFIIKQNWDYEKFEVENEIFFLIKKNS